MQCAFNFFSITVLISGYRRIMCRVVTLEYKRVLERRNNSKHAALFVNPKKIIVRVVSPILNSRDVF